MARPTFAEKTDRLATLDEDVLYRRVCEHVERTRRCSVTDIQLSFRIGVQLAFRLIDRMVDNGVISAPPNRIN